jgi:glucokinase
MEAPSSALVQLAKSDMRCEARHLVAALARNDGVAQKILDEVTGDLAFGLSHVVHLFHPQVIVLGGGLSKVGELLRAGVEASLRRCVMDAFAPGPMIRLAALGDDAVPVGALCLAATRSRAADSGLEN